MKRFFYGMLLCICVVLITACAGDADHATEPKEATVAQASEEKTPDTEYGILQELIDSYGFPFILRHTEGMGIVRFEMNESFAVRRWSHSMEGDSTHDNLSWTVNGNILTISGDWEESFTLDMEMGTATSLIDGVQYRLFVQRPDGDGTQAYVEWESDQGVWEENGEKQ